MVARRIVGVTLRSTMRGEGGWPPVAEALETAGLWTIKEYIQHRQATVVDRVTCHPIYELFTVSEQMPVTSNFMWWWYQDVVYKV